MVGIGADRGPWVTGLIGAGYRVYAINPRSLARFRDWHHVDGARSDDGDAKLLSDLLRKDLQNHRPVFGDSYAATGVKVFARSHQLLIRDRTPLTNRLRNTLGEYFAAAMEASQLGRW